MRILITGASGFVGSHVLEELKKRYPSESLIALSSKEIEGIRTISSRNYDFGDEYLLNNGCGDIDTIVHVGAWTPKNAKEADDFLEATSNIENTQRLITLKLPKLKRIVYCSTLDVYGNVTGVITEETSIYPQSLYGWSKLYCEKMIESFAKKRNLIFQNLRLGHVYGEGEEKYRKVMPIMIENAVHGKDIIIYGDGEAIRTFVYIDDVARAIANAITLNMSNIINVVGSEPVTINQLADVIATYSGEEVKIYHKTTNVANRDYLFDNHCLREYLLEELTPFDTGLRREIDYMKKRTKE